MGLHENLEKLIGPDLLGIRDGIEVIVEKNVPRYWVTLPDNLASAKKHLVDTFDGSGTKLEHRQVDRIVKRVLECLFEVLVFSPASHNRSRHASRFGCVSYYSAFGVVLQEELALLFH